MALVKTYLIVTITIFVTLALLVRALPHFPLDLAITHTLQAQRSPGLDILMQAISWPGYPPQLIFLLAAVVVFIYALGFRWEAVMIGLCAGSAQLLIRPIVRLTRNLHLQRITSVPTGLLGSSHDF